MLRRVCLGIFLLLSWRPGASKEMRGPPVSRRAYTSLYATVCLKLGVICGAVTADVSP